MWAPFIWLTTGLYRLTQACSPLSLTFEEAVKDLRGTVFPVLSAPAVGRTSVVS